MCYFDIPGYSNYKIDEEGNVKSNITGKVMSVHFTKGYKYMRLLNDESRSVIEGVHRLMAWAFIGLPSDPEHVVNHIDGNKLNNSKGNLEWVPRSENNHHAFETGLNNCGRMPVLMKNRATGIVSSFWSATACALALAWPTPDKIHRRIRNRPGVVFPDNLMFKYDDGSDWPEEKKDAPPGLKARIVAYNVLEDEVVIFEGFATGSRLTGVSAMAILKAAKSERNIPIRGWLFRHQWRFDGIWPVFDDLDKEIIKAQLEDAALSSGFLIEKENEVKLLPSFKHAIEFFGVSKDKLYKSIQDKKPIDGWNIKFKKII